ncbi:MAG: beta-ketoacyl-ACP synthase II [Hyphomonadaceae bacterium]|nr:beta-ketoacyl-ACP synthase II [Clostridia bacterium]
MERVVITGMGAITSLGQDAETFWQSIKKGVCGIDYIQSMDTSNFKVKIAAEVKDFEPENFMEKKEARRMDRYCQFGMAAAELAIKQSGLNVKENIDATRLGVIVGSGVGGLYTTEKEAIKLHEKGPDRVSPILVPMIISNIAAGNIAIRYGAKGICTSVTTACATGTHAIGDAFKMLRHGELDAMIAGACEAPITPLGLAGFINITAVTTRNDINRSSIPFDKERDGFVMAEGAGILVLETLSHALGRGAKILGEIVGYGATCDAYHMTAPDPKGDGAARSMQLAIKDAGITPADISYINAHGTSTPPNDLCETMAIKTVFGEGAYNIPVSSTKSMTGHLLGAAGGVEAIVCIKALEDGFVPPTIHYQVPDEALDLDYVPNVGREANLTYALSNSLGFGGHNGTLIFKKYE